MTSGTEDTHSNEPMKVVEDFALSSEEIERRYDEILLEALNCQYNSRFDEELSEAKTEYKQSGHSLDKFITAFSGSVLGLAGSSYANTELKGDESFRILSLWLVFASLLLSLLNLIFASISCNQRIKVMNIIECAHNFLSLPNGLNRDALISARKQTIEMLNVVRVFKNFVAAPKELFEVGSDRSKFESQLQSRQDVFLDKLTNVRNAPFTKYANICLVLSLITLSIGIAMMILFLISTKR